MSQVIDPPEQLRAEAQALGEKIALNAPDALAIECSTLSHDWVMDLARRVRARGFRYVDAPVTVVNGEFAEQAH